MLLRMKNMAGGSAPSGPVVPIWEWLLPLNAISGKSEEVYQALSGDACD